MGFGSSQTAYITMCREVKSNGLRSVLGPGFCSAGAEWDEVRLSALPELPQHSSYPHMDLVPLMLLSICLFIAT